VSVIYFLLPLAGLLVTAAVVAFFVAARGGQFDDLDTPPLRALFDDEPRERARISDADRRKSEP
jgi:cbb3-type cytochrome oxidase maturation protein